MSSLPDPFAYFSIGTAEATSGSYLDAHPDADISACVNCWHKVLTQAKADIAGRHRNPEQCESTLGWIFYEPELDPHEIEPLPVGTFQFVCATLKFNADYTRRMLMSKWPDWAENWRKWLGE